MITLHFQFLCMVYPAWVENIYIIWRNVKHKSRVHPHLVILYLSSIACKNFMFSFPVLWLTNNDLEALEIMNEVTQRLRERELKQAKETVIIYKFIVHIKLTKMSYCRLLKSSSTSKLISK